MNTQESLVFQECLGDYVYQAFDDLDFNLSSKSQDLIYSILSSTNVINEDYVVKSLIYRIVSSELADLVKERYKNDSHIKANNLFSYVSLNIYSQYITIMNLSINLIKGENYAKIVFTNSYDMRFLCEQTASEGIDSTNDGVCRARGQNDWSNVTSLDTKRIKNRE
jgi:hypothetical protein